VPVARGLSAREICVWKMGLPLLSVEALMSWKSSCCLFFCDHSMREDLKLTSLRAILLRLMKRWMRLFSIKCRVVGYPWSK